MFSREYLLPDSAISSLALQPNAGFNVGLYKVLNIHTYLGNVLDGEAMACIDGGAVSFHAVVVVVVVHVVHVAHGTRTGRYPTSIRFSPFLSLFPSISLPLLSWNCRGSFSVTHSTDGGCCLLTSTADCHPDLSNSPPSYLIWD